MTTLTNDDGVKIEPTEEQLARWKAAEQAYLVAEAEKAVLFEAAEDAELNRLLAEAAEDPDYDPDAPVGPVRDLFPRVTATRRPVIYDGLDRFRVPRSAR